MRTGNIGGHELGKCLESLVIATCKTLDSFQPASRIGSDEPYDLRIDNLAIDTKYRVGSSDSATLKKFKQHGPLLREHGYEPVFLFLRADNLPAAMTPCEKGGWTIYIEKQSFQFIKDVSGFDLENYLIRKAKVFSVNR